MFPVAIVINFKYINKANEALSYVSGAEYHSLFSI